MGASSMGAVSPAVSNGNAPVSSCHSLVSSCGSSTGPVSSAPPLSVSPTTVDLGTVGVGGLGEASITLQNDGGGAIEVLSASLVEGDARAWAVARDSFEPLTGAAVTPLTTTFSPDDEGPSPAQVQIRSDDREAPSLYIAEGDRKGRDSV